VTFTSSFVTLSMDGGYGFRLGTRPGDLGGGKAPTARDRSRQRVFERRLCRSPLTRAAGCRQRLQGMGARNVRDFPRRSGEDWSVVARHLRLLRLPTEILGFLARKQTPAVRQLFTTKRLDDLTRMPEDQALAAVAREAALVQPGFSSDPH